MFNPLKLYIIALVLLAVVGCAKSDLHLQIRFNQNPGLKADDPVVFQGNQAGVVKKVSYTEQGDYLIEIRVASEFKNAATTDSSFTIINDPKDADKFNLVIEQIKPGGKVLEDNSVVLGVDQRSFMDSFIHDLNNDLEETITKLKKEFEKKSVHLKSGIENTIDSLAAQLEQYKKEIRQVPERKDVKKLEKSLRNLYDEMLTTQKSIRTKIQTEIIPKVEKEIEDLKKKLAPSGRDSEVAPIESDLEKIKKI
jgi:vacuolar-type H+-ATPase subunit H